MFESEDLKRVKSLPLDKQVGGDHYVQLAVQPIEYITKNKYYGYSKEIKI